VLVFWIGFNLMLIIN